MNIKALTQSFFKASLQLCRHSEVSDLPFLFWKLQWIDNASFKQTALKMSTERVKAIGVKQRHYQYTWGVSKIYETGSLTARLDSHTQGGRVFIIHIPRSYKQVQKHTLQCLSSLKTGVLVFQYQHLTLIPRRTKILKCCLRGAQREQVLAGITFLLLFHIAGNNFICIHVKGKITSRRCINLPSSEIKTITNSPE